MSRNIIKPLVMPHANSFSSAIGCPDIVPPKNSWVQRKVDKFEIGCASSDTALWELTCVGSDWKGELGSCDGDGPLMGGVLSGIPKAASSVIGFVSSLPFGWTKSDAFFLLE